MMWSIQICCGVIALPGRKISLGQGDSFLSQLSHYFDAGALHSLQESQCEEVTTRPSAISDRMNWAWLARSCSMHMAV